MYRNKRSNTLEKSEENLTEEEQLKIKKLISGKGPLISAFIEENFDVRTWTGYLAAVNSLCATLEALIFYSMNDSAGRKGMINYCVELLKSNLKRCENELENPKRK